MDTFKRYFKNYEVLNNQINNEFFILLCKIQKKKKNNYFLFLYKTKSSKKFSEI